MSGRVRVCLLVGGLVLIAVLVVRAGPVLVLDMLVGVGWAFLGVIALYAGHQGVRAVALWRSIVAQPIRFADVLRIRLSGEAVEMLTYTGPFLAEPAKGWLLNRSGLPAAEAFAAVATEYLLYTTVSASLAVAACSLLLERGVVPNLLRPLALAVSAGMLAFTAGVVFAAVSGIGLVAPVVRATSAFIGDSRAAKTIDWVDRVERVLVSFLHEHPTRVAEVLALETAAHALLMSEVWIVLVALGRPLGFFDLLIVEGGAKLIASAFFFVPGQLGASEAVYVSLLRAIGLPVAVGLTFGLVRRVRGLLVAAAGLLALVWCGDGQADDRPRCPSGDDRP